MPLIVLAHLFYLRLVLSPNRYFTSANLILAISPQLVFSRSPLYFSSQIRFGVTVKTPIKGGYSSGLYSLHLILEVIQLQF